MTICLAVPLNHKQMNTSSFKPADELVDSSFSGSEPISADDTCISTLAKAVENQMSTLIEHLPGGILLEGMDGRIVKINAALCLLFGFSGDPDRFVGFKTEAAQRLIRDQFSNWKAVNQSINGLRAKGERISNEVLSMKDGSFYQWDFIPIKEGGRITYNLWHIRDSTSAKRSQLELVKAMVASESGNVAKKEFMSLLARELRVPMNAIQGVTELMLDSCTTEDQRDYAMVALSATGSAIEILEDLVDFSYLDSGNVSLDMNSFNIHEMVEEICMVMNTQFSNKPVCFIVNMDPRIPPYLLGNAKRLKQVIINLISNSVKHTKEGHVLLELKVLVNSPTLCQVEFLIEDTGEGLNSENLALLKESLITRMSPWDKRVGGLGLGLAISRDLVNLMDGVLEFDSQEGDGSCGHFTLEMRTDLERNSEINEFNAQKRSCLIVVTNQIQSGILKRQFEYWNWDVEVVRDLNCWQSRLKNVKSSCLLADYILIDADMSRGSSTSFAGALSSLPQGRSPTRVLLGNNRALVDSIMYRKIGFSALLLNPVNPLRMRRLFKKLEDGETLDVHNGATIEKEIDSSYVTQWRYKALVFEDNSTNQLVMMNMLRALKCKADIAGTGAEGMELYKNNVYDIIFMDYELPDMEGWEIAREIRSMEGETSHMPILALTAYTTPDIEDRCLKSGMDEFFTKPVERNRLKLALEKWCNIYSVGDEITCDFNALKKQYNENMNLIQRLYAVFKEKLPRQLSELNEKIRREKVEAVLAETAVLKSSLILMQGRKAFFLIRELEGTIQVGDWRKSAKVFIAFENNVEELLSFLKKQLEVSL